MKAAYSAHRISKLQALSDSVLVEDMTFDERISNGGIVLLNDNGKSSGIRPTDVRVGEWILVAHGRWTRGLDIEDDEGKRTIRKIDPKDILMSADERPADVTFSDAINVEKKER
jgi:hypothetical protein